MLGGETNHAPGYRMSYIHRQEAQLLRGRVRRAPCVLGAAANEAGLKLADDSEGCYMDKKPKFRMLCGGRRIMNA